MDSGTREDASVPVDAPAPLDAPPPIDAESATDGGAIGTDAGAMARDAGFDATPMRTDAGAMGTDAGPMGCASAADCSDGRGCNGIERCEGGRCVAGAPMACDDGISCTMDACIEPGTCAYTPSDTLCPAGQRCTATGCTPTTMCSESPCRLVAPQCGCATGEACYLAGTSRYCASAGRGTESSPCTGSTDCAAGLDCIDYSSRTGASATQCARYCSSDSGCSGAGALCVQQLGDGMGGVLPGVLLCSHACDPTTSSGCAPGLSCQVFQESAGARRFLTECTGPVGAGTQWSSCTDNADCARGYGCFMGTLGSECLRWCRVGAAGSCPAGLTCYAFSTPVVVGSTQYGVCDL